MSGEELQPEFPARRVVLLGASNLIRGISTVVETARQVWNEPLDILAALGHGRSYGPAETFVLMRGLPGILSCGIWRAIDRRPSAPTVALFTDIGNDILYGASVGQISSWVEQCLHRVSQFSERIVITQLPMDSIAKIQRWQFLLMRSLFFPSSRVKFDDAISRAERLNRAVLDLARQFDAIVVKPRAQWYGFDPIHMKLRVWPRAWREILAEWREETNLDEYLPSMTRWLMLRSLRPERRRLFGLMQRKKQPAIRLRDGSCVSFY